MNDMNEQTAKFDQETIAEDRKITTAYINEKLALLTLIHASKVLIGANEAYELTEAEWQKFYAAVLAAEAVGNG